MAWDRISGDIRVPKFKHLSLNHAGAPRKSLETPALNVDDKVEVKGRKKTTSKDKDAKAKPKKNNTLSLKDIEVNLDFQAPSVLKPSVRKLKFSELKISPNSIETDKFVFKESGVPGTKIPLNPDGKYVFKPGEPLFDTFNLLGILTSEVNMFEKYSGRPVTWGNELHKKLTVYPHAGKMANAYYAERLGGVKVFYTPFINPKGEYGIYRLSNDPDVVTHEVGHALLDSIRDEYNESFYPETRAIHEAMADTIAMLTASRDENVLKAMINSKGKLKTHGLLPVIGEGSGPVFSYETLESIFEHFYPFSSFSNFIGKLKDLVDKGIRDLNNDFKYKPFNQLEIRLKRRKGEDPIAFLRRIRKAYSGEEHSYSRVLSGAIWDTVKNAYSMRREENPSEQPVDTLRSVMDDLAKDVIKGLSLAPVSEPSFKELAKSFIAADIRFNNGKLLRALTKSFIDRKILTEEDIQEVHDRFKTAEEMNLTLKNKLPDIPLGVQRRLRNMNNNPLAKLINSLLGNKEEKEDKSKGFGDDWKKLNDEALKMAKQFLDKLESKGHKLDRVALKNLKFYEMQKDKDGNIYLLYNYGYGVPILLGKGERYELNAGLLLAFDKNGKLFYYDFNKPEIQKMRDTARYLEYLMSISRIRPIDSIKNPDELLSLAGVIDRNGKVHPTGVIVD